MIQRSKNSILAEAKTWPVHSFERIFLVSSTQLPAERLRILNAARAKNFLSKEQFHFLKRGGIPDLESAKKPKVPTEYREYIKSNIWKNRREKYWNMHKKECRVCHSTKSVQLHHASYEELGGEPDSVLVPFCGEHHKGFHKRFGVGRKMIKRTKRYIKKTKVTIGIRRK